MDNERAKYIIGYFSNLLSSVERMAIKHTTSTYKINNSTSDNTSLTKVYRERGWLTSDQNVLDLLKDGYDNFELNVANRILNQDSDKVFFNNCPKCNKLARTPYARQCRHCGHSWHELTVAQFKLNSSFQLTGRQFFLLGEVTKGEIKQGQFMDLTMLGLNKKPKIEAVEFTLKRQDGKVWEDIGLGTNDLTENDKEYLKNIGSFGTPFDIIKER
ncbi:hypothetical protein [Sphingobacterium bambusae]|uniref:Tim44-like domain-containing protein n=1 Tax=Sphingobacterium bambusae TaxID=662858 RepID=A0ABW6BH06_9SPHI|nr:hypothetical protein [Sphingobacterium bambusae]WPL47486.1 hypothetical protein SCB77_16150 [Sphingobacterium bambusae]